LFCVLPYFPSVPPPLCFGFPVSSPENYPTSYWFASLGPLDHCCIVRFLVTIFRMPALRSFGTLPVPRFLFVWTRLGFAGFSRSGSPSSSPKSQKAAPSFVAPWRIDLCLSAVDWGQKFRPGRVYLTFFLSFYCPPARLLVSGARCIVRVAVFPPFRAHTPRLAMSSSASA